MPDKDKIGHTLARVSVATLYLNGLYLTWDVACHARNPNCDYQFEAIGLTSTASDTGVVLPSAVIRST
ncbi:MAG: hypothetical protein WED13_01110 [Methyloceanibacter sp.]